MHHNWVAMLQSKTDGKDQEKIQSSTIPDPGYDMGNPYFVACKHQRCRSACASAQSDQRL